MTFVRPILNIPKCLESSSFLWFLERFHTSTSVGKASGIKVLQRGVSESAQVRFPVVA